MKSLNGWMELPRRLHIHPVVRVALLTMMVSQVAVSHVQGAEKGKIDPYDVLYDVIMTRHKGGKTYAQNESSPALFTESKFPFDDRTFPKFKAALDAFEALPQDKLDAYSDVKRALMQRHLWKLFDANIPFRWVDSRTGKLRYANLNLPARRAEVQPKIASLIHRLALSRAQIQALPDTHSVTAKSGGFPPSHDPTDQFKPFFPPDLHSPDGSWVCMGTDEPVPADLHVERIRWRSAIYTFLRLPQGRLETLNYITEAAGSKGRLPVGTQVALVEQAFLIDDQGELVLSPLTVSVSLRGYLRVELSKAEPRSTPTQCVTEFVMQPRQLMRGNAIMKSITPLEHRFEVSEKFICQDTRDPFETGRISSRTRLNSCMGCHRNSGNARILSKNGAGSSRFFASNRQTLSTAASGEKRNDYTWQALSEYWQQSPE